jgi:F-box protein 4
VITSTGQDGGIRFLDLPVGVHLHIFSFLDAGSLCRLAQTCDYMYNLSSDPLLWTRLLERDIHGWRVIGHSSHPQVYKDAASDLSPKQIYCQCRCHRDTLPHQSFAHPITGRLRSLVRRIQGHIPRLLMFGSGLESVPLVRSMLWEGDSPYRPIGLYPGKDGVGSGVCIQHKDTPVNLITLYTATRAERLAAQSGQQARVNKLVSVDVTQSREEEGGDAELTPAVQQLCRQADAFVLVVDACHMTEEALRLDLSMLQAMLHSNVSLTTPLLVLSCQPNVTEDSSPPQCVPPPCEVANRLRLCELHQPWQVRCLVLNQYQPLQDGMDWLLGAAHC